MLGCSYLRMWTVSRKEEEENRVKEDKEEVWSTESGHERKSPEGLAVLGYRGVANNLQWDKET